VRTTVVVETPMPKLESHHHTERTEKIVAAGLEGWVERTKSRHHGFDLPSQCRRFVFCRRRTSATERRGCQLQVSPRGVNTIQILTNAERTFGLHSLQHMVFLERTSGQIIKHHLRWHSEPSRNLLVGRTREVASSRTVEAHMEAGSRRVTNSDAPPAPMPKGRLN
jgi:hypothetical protein